MGMIERDPYTGHGTTGHEWNGIKELNTAVPRVIWAFLIVTVLFSVVWWVLMPAWPTGETYTKGLLGADVRENVARSLETAAERRSIWTQRIAQEDFAAIQADETLMEDVRETGHALFGDNCAACHGTDAAGGPGFPSLADDAWLWGGTPDAVFETIRAGINSDHPETRYAQMLAFGRDGMLDRQSILDVVDYVRSLGPASDSETAIPEERLAAGREVFATTCASCHGENAAGNIALGAPDLTDGFWIYGGDRGSIFDTVYNGRQGHMPGWENRLTEIDRKILTLYLLNLGEETK